MIICLELEERKRGVGRWPLIARDPGKLRPKEFQEKHFGNRGIKLKFWNW